MLPQMSAQARVPPIIGINLIGHVVQFRPDQANDPVGVWEVLAESAVGASVRFPIGLVEHMSLPPLTLIGMAPPQQDFLKVSFGERPGHHSVWYVNTILEDTVTSPRKTRKAMHSGQSGVAIHGECRPRVPGEKYGGDATVDDNVA